MTDPLFSASRLKLERAKQFIQELKGCTEQYLRSNPVSVEPEERPGTGPRLHFFYKPVGPLPGAIIGDAIHNMRTSLDLMASDLARINKKKPDDVYFPFAASAAALDDAIRNKCFRKAGDDAVKLLKTFEPYRGGNDLLRGLHDLDLMDKHTSLIPGVESFDAVVSGAYSNDGSKPSIVNVEKVNVRFVFRPGQVFADRRIVETLEEIMQMVEGVLQSFALLVASRTP
jgi:hypothetical protein